ncbi:MULTISPECIES: glycosyltransferase [Psychrilyobacter]|uniref:Glycosyltransferase n=1 Tax=Psychrilyobacter piezotolerans TaxID=2293438 RepID=A0ABX9KEB4_9FUSO|nr:MULTISPECIES: glycosyltransferase [Psychrilyobacter]MCS5422120.1 glycosyltransferase [Psychrilyobacter sp. S5]NDI76283.1 glycosyltransferase [Psychrilyobacter piezotolerans]RDE59168.1 glycosyltransferase [Psychrilyobacter sp. S5]REI39730.1 glycosyltransferase [Psychrilyobacter piezotolerans]
MNNGDIIYIGSYEMPDKSASAHRVLNNAKVFRELGYRVIFIDVDRNKENKKPFHKKNNIQDFDCWSIARYKTPLNKINYYFNIKYFKQIIKECNNIKLIICYNYPSGAFLRIKNYCKRHNIRLIADCTEWYEAKNKLGNIDNNIRMNYIQKNIDGVICISSYLENFYKKSTKTICIPPLVDKTEEKWNCEMLDFDDNKIHFVYSGVPGRHKDKLNLIIEALYSLSENYILHIIGITKEEYLNYYPKHSNYLEKLGEVVEFLGRTSHLDSLKYVKSADFSVFIRENKRVNNAGFPTKYIESISAGTPVITTNTSDLKKYIVEGENGFLINECSKKEIKNTLGKVLNMNRWEIEEMKNYCRNNSNDFDYRNYVKRYQNFFNKVVK